MTSKLINPDGHLLQEIVAKQFLARKTAGIWARLVSEREAVITLENEDQFANPGDYVCRGVADELWPQSANSLMNSYEPVGEADAKGWQEFRVKDDVKAVKAAEMDCDFGVNTSWSKTPLEGKAGDYAVQRPSDPSDVWIVRRDIFQATYERVE